MAASDGGISTDDLVLPPPTATPTTIATVTCQIGMTTSARERALPTTRSTLGERMVFPARPLTPIAALMAHMSTRGSL